MRAASTRPGKACPWSAARETLFLTHRLLYQWCCPTSTAMHGPAKQRTSCGQDNLSAASTKAENPESKESHYHAPQPAGFDVSKRRGKSERLAITDFLVRQRDFRDVSVALTVAHVAARPSSPRGSGPGPWLACCVIGLLVK